MEADTESPDKIESESVTSLAPAEVTAENGSTTEKPIKKKRAVSTKTSKESKETKKPRAATKKSTAFLSPEKAAADRNALQALGMSVSKKNLDTMQTKKTVVKEVTRKRRLNELESSIASLEEKEKKEKDDLAKLKKQKQKLESDSNVKFPVADELIESLDPKGPKLTPLPMPAPKAGLPDDLLTDVLFVWNFLHVFSDELHLKPIPFDDLVNVLNFSASDSFVLVEILSSLLRLLLRDHSLAVQISSQVPSHVNFASKETEKTALENLKESACVERHRDWSYNGLKLLPKKIRVDVVDGLRWQSVLRCVLPRLPIFKDLLRASDPSFDMLLALELREGAEGDGYKGSNKDWAYGILANMAEELELVSDALTKIESNEFYSLSLLQKLSILRQLCLACYDCAPVRHLLAKHHEERNQSVANLNAVRNSQKRALRQVSAEMKARATEECRKVNAANLSKGKKSTKKNPLDPSPAQLNAMLDDLILMDSVKVNVVMEPPDDKTGADSSSTPKGSRAYTAEEEKKKRERELTAKMREDALFYLESAMESGRDKDVRESIRYAKQAGLEGKLPDGKVYCHPMLFKVYRHRANMEQATKEQKVQAEHEKDLAKLFVRTEPVGYDRNGCAYYCFDGDSRLWVQTLEAGVPREAGSTSTPAVPSAYETLTFVRPSTRKFTWRVHATMPDVWRVIEALDERGVRERELKAKLVARFGLSGKSADGATYQTEGSEYIGSKVRRSFGKRVVVGTIVGWLPPEGEDMALWHVVHEDGDEEDLEESEVKDFLVSETSDAPEGDAEVIQGDSQESKEETEAMELEGAEKLEPESTQDEEEEEPDVLFRYFNNAPGGLSLRPHQIGIDGLRQELLRMAGRLTDGLKSRGSGFQKDVRREWEHCVRQADSIAQFRDSLRELEEFVHGTQQAPDKVDESSARDKREVMQQDGWIFDAEVEGKAALEELEKRLTEARSRDHTDQPLSKKRPTQQEPTEESLLEEMEACQRGVSMLGRRGRRFFDNHGKSDGTIVAFMRSGLNDGIALWHMEHDDGDCEDLDSKDLERVLAYFDSDAQEKDENDEDQHTNESGDESNGGSECDAMSEETDDEEDGLQSAGSDLLLWPSLDTRNRWRHALSQSHTVSEVALALSSFMDYAERFGITSPDPLDAYGTSLSLVSRRMWRESMGGGRESIGRAPVKSNQLATRSSSNSERTAGRGKDVRRSSLKAAEGSRRLLRDRAAKKMVSYLE